MNVGSKVAPSPISAHPTWTGVAAHAAASAARALALDLSWASSSSCAATELAAWAALVSSITGATANSAVRWAWCRTASSAA
jgi:hypothetical protein